MIAPDRFAQERGAIQAAAEKIIENMMVDMSWVRGNLEDQVQFFDKEAQRIVKSAGEDSFTTICGVTALCTACAAFLRTTDPASHMPDGDFVQAVFEAFKMQNILQSSDEVWIIARESLMFALAEDVPDVRSISQERMIEVCSMLIRFNESVC